MTWYDTIQYDSMIQYDAMYYDVTSYDTRYETKTYDMT